MSASATPGTSLDAFVAGRPTQFTQRLGQVETNFNNYDFGLYWQDDVRVNKSFSYSIGLRQEMQSHINDKLNPMPRLGFTWNPLGSRTAPSNPGEPYKNWADGRCPFPRPLWEAAGFEVLAFDCDDTPAIRQIAHALGWDKGESAMDLDPVFDPGQALATLIATGWITQILHPLQKEQL